MEYLIQQYLSENNLTGINGIDYTLQDDGDGPYIKTWDLEIKEPVFTNSDYAEVQLMQTKNEKISQIKATAAFLILATYPIYKQSNILMSQDDDLIEQMGLFISAIRAKSNELEAALDFLTKPEEIRNFPIKF